MAKEKREPIYGDRRPEGYRFAHNHVRHTPEFIDGQNGFRRFWIPPEYIESGKWVECPCGWRRSRRVKAETHFALKEHVQWWNEQIQERGSLEAVHKFILEDELITKQ